MRRLVFLFSFATLVFSCLQLAAQEQPAPQTDATAYTSVSGHVICGDTGLPGRFAAVQLVPEKPQKTTFAADLGTVKDSKGFAKALAKNMAQPKKGTGLSAVSSIDGSFEMPKVPAGTYYVVAQLSGYPSPFSALTSMERFAADADAISRIQALAEKIVVQSAPVRLDVRLERGGSISGVIHYGDGSPAAGVSPVLMALQENGKWKADFDPGNQQKHTTDDRGRYRISGLAKGKYAIKAELPTNQMISGLGGSTDSHFSWGDALVVYSGGVLREKDIKPIEVGLGDEVDGIDISFPVDNIHQVSGTVVAKVDNHPLNSGWASLIDPETKETLRHTQLEEDGSFKFNYIPEGQYALSISHPGDTDKSAQVDAYAQMIHPTFLKNYQDATIQIDVKSDLTGLTVQVADQPAAGAPAKPPTP